MNQLISTEQKSPFHRGEQLIQNRLGVRNKMEQFGQRVIRNYMPEQHKQFYQQLEYILVAHVDTNGKPWASILHGKTGFIETPDEHHIFIKSQAIKGDPLAAANEAGTKLALLGIELNNRRRNRLSGTLIEHSKAGILLKVEQTFGNCPQYIQQRQLKKTVSKNLQSVEKIQITTLNNAAIKLIKHADTFFLASHNLQQQQIASHGADISHRGGLPGFVHIDSPTSLTIPDYKGNNHFNSLGNFIENKQAGLLFIDFKRGHLLSLTGSVEIHWQHPDINLFPGAERLWQFQLEQGFWLKNALPFHWHFISYANELEKQKLKKQALKETAEWQNIEISNIIQESSNVKSFYFKQPTDKPFIFNAGQFIQLKTSINQQPVIRNYSLSSAPDDDFVRISIKYENGIFSSYMHNTVKTGDRLQLKKLALGNFSLSSATVEPVVLICAGIGITPMISICRNWLMHHDQQKLIMICTARNAKQRAFYNELKQISRDHPKRFQLHWLLSQPESNLLKGLNYDFSGRLNRSILKRLLPKNIDRFMLCGPSGFMQSQYQNLINLGYKAHKIHSEAFGSATLNKENKTLNHKNIANSSIIQFKKSAIELQWSKTDGHLLDFAESHGISTHFSCRRGECGICKVKLLEGKVIHSKTVLPELKANEALLCCALPAQDNSLETQQISLDL